jgi:hypothetical protein
VAKLTKTVFFLVAFAAMSPAQTPIADRTVTGVVFGASGQPAKNIQVSGCHHNPVGGYEMRHTRTDLNGRFELGGVGRVIFFRSVEFKPATWIVTSDAPQSVTLENAASTTWQVPACQALQSGYKRVGSILRITMPRNVRVKRSVGDDTWEDMVSFKEHPDQQLKIWEGPGNYTSGSPVFSGFVHEDWVSTSSDLAERLLTSGRDVIGLETSGRDERGNRWRWIDTSMGVIYYRGLKHDAASYFDGLLSTACH